MSNKSTANFDEKLEGMNLRSSAFHAEVLEPIVEGLITDERAKSLEIWPNNFLTTFFWHVSMYNRDDKSLLNLNTVYLVDLARQNHSLKNFSG